MTDTPSIDPTRGRRQLGLLALVFFGPLIVAIVMYATGVSGSGSGVNYGELLSPTVSLEDKTHFEMGIRGRWTLVAVPGASCDESCERSLIDIRQIRLATGREIDRIERVVILNDGERLSQELVSAHPGLKTFPRSSALGQAIQDAGVTSGIVIVDPIGNLILRYPLAPERKAMLGDLKKLLKLSRIG